MCRIYVIFVVKLKTQGCLCSCQVARGDCLKSWLRLLWAVMLFACRSNSCLPKNLSLQEYLVLRLTAMLFISFYVRSGLLNKIQSVPNSVQRFEFWTLRSPFMSRVWSKLCKSALQLSMPQLVLQFLLEIVENSKFFSEISGVISRIAHLKTHRLSKYLICYLRYFTQQELHNE